LRIAACPYQTRSVPQNKSSVKAVRQPLRYGANVALAKSRHAEERAPIFQSNIRKKPEVLPETFILDQALVI
jgi:hypothetical protein